MELGPEDNYIPIREVSSFQRVLCYRLQWSWDLKMCPYYSHFRGCYVQASMELGPEDVSLLERCPHFRGCYVQASMELGPEDNYIPIREVSSFQRVLCTGFNGVGT